MAINVLVHYNDSSIIFHDIAKHGSSIYSGLGQTAKCIDPVVTETASGSARPPGRDIATECVIVCPEKESVTERERERIMGYPCRWSKHIDSSDIV